MTVACFCGYDSVATCRKCGGRFCPSHSRLVGDRVLCLDDLSREQATAAAARAADDERHRAATTAWENDIQPMSGTDAVELLLFPVEGIPNKQQINSARAAARGLDPGSFTEICLRLVRQHGVQLKADSSYGGGGRGPLSKILRAAKAYECWWLPDKAGQGGNRGRGIGVTPDRRWMEHTSNGEDGYGFRSWDAYFEMTRERMLRLLGIR